MAAELIVPRPRPRIAWKDAAPHAEAFGDVYFNPADGLGESRHVFLAGLGIPEAWRGRERYTLCELGFGTGLNFLATLAAWRQEGAAGRLCYIGIEGFPLARQDLARTLAAFPELAGDAAALIAAWPPPYPGFHRLVFGRGRVQLTLILAEVHEALDALHAPVDGWYLDGFAPDRNPDMWDAAVFSRMAALSKPGTRVASFSVAGLVRRGLEAAGFAVTRRPGFARKRHALAAEFRASSIASVPRARRFPELLALPPPAAEDPIAIVGAGLAGSLLARALAQTGREVILFDPMPERPVRPPVALLAPRPDLGTGPRARYEMLAGLFAQRFYATEMDPDVFASRGIMQMPAAGRSRHGARAIAHHLGWEEDWLSFLPRADVLWGGFTPCPALFWPRAGAIDSAGLIAALGAGLAIRRAAVCAIVQEGGGWRLLDEAGSAIATAPTVVVAAGPASPRVLAAWPLGTALLGGSLLQLDAPRKAQPPVPALAQGFVIPQRSANGAAAPLILGAGHWMVDQAIGAGPAMPPKTGGLRTKLLKRCSLLAPEMVSALARAPICGRFDGLRLVTRDRLPLVGPLWAAEETPRLRRLLAADRRRHLPDLPLAPGLFLLSGFAGRGFTHAPLAARLLADLLLGDPPALPPDIIAALHPARMLAC